MKKLKISALCTVVLLLFVFLFQLNVFADDESIKIYLNGSQLTTQVPPAIIDDRTMVPLRDIFEALGVKVEWVVETKSINALKGTRWVKLQIGSNNATINGSSKLLDAAPTIIESRTLVPLRFVAESFNAKVDWIGESRTINITYNDKESMADEEIVPPLPIKGDFKWSIIDTEYCRVYYYQKEDYVKYSVRNIDNVLLSVMEKFDGKPRNLVLNNNKIAIYFLDEDTRNEFLKTQRTDSFASWSGNHMAMFINLDIVNSRKNIDVTLTHEFTHAITMWGSNTILKNIPGWYAEGLAVNYMLDLKNGGNIDYKTVKDAIRTGKVVPWSNIIKKSGSWVEDTALCYKESATIIGYLIEKYGEKAVIELFQKEGNFYNVLKQLTSKSLEQLEEDWKSFVLAK